VIEAMMDDSAPTPVLAYLDLTMLAVLGARERTLEEYKALLEMAGFSLTSVRQTSTPFALIEAIAA
jgi:hypothetical protein